MIQMIQTQFPLSYTGFIKKALPGHPDKASVFGRGIAVPPDAAMRGLGRIGLRQVSR